MTDIITTEHPRERKQFVTVTGISDSKRLPRIGRIRLGVKQAKGDKSYPVETDYFVVEQPDANAPLIDRALHAKFVEVYGKTPRSLDIILPSEDREVFAPQAYKCYGAASLKCIGDGADAMRLGADGKFAEVAGGCPGPDKCQFSLNNGRNSKPGCKFVASIFVILPKVSLGGSFQIVTGSKNAALSLSASIDAIRRMFGHVAGLAYIDPEMGKAATALRIVRRPVKMQYEGKSRVHYPVSIESSLTIDQILQLQRAGVLSGADRATPALPAEVASQDSLPESALLAHSAVEAAPEGVDFETGEVLSAAESHGAIAADAPPPTGYDDPFGDRSIASFDEPTAEPVPAAEHARVEHTRGELAPTASPVAQKRIEQERLEQTRLEVASLLTVPSGSHSNDNSDLEHAHLEQASLLAAIDSLSVKPSTKILLRKKAEQCPDVVRDELIKMGRIKPVQRRAA